MEDVTDADFTQPKRVCKDFEVFKNYTLLLADVLGDGLKIYELTLLFFFLLHNYYGNQY